MMRVSTSIGQSDNILQGKSYYMAEVETALEMARSKETGKQHLFLLDELFRGTNTTERVAAAYALLSYLNRGNDLVVVATHDIELLGLLGASFESYHFRETIAEGALTFDFRIRAGPSSTRNAIALLQVMQFPKDLVRDALSMTDWPGRKPDRD
jgi:DNA mismatch repair ATPase MutS